MGQKKCFKNAVFRNVLFWNLKEPHTSLLVIMCLYLFRGPPKQLFKLCPLIKNGHALGTTIFNYMENS